MKKFNIILKNYDHDHVCTVHTELNIDVGISDLIFVANKPCSLNLSEYQRTFEFTSTSRLNAVYTIPPDQSTNLRRSRFTRFQIKHSKLELPSHLQQPI